MRQIRILPMFIAIAALPFMSLAHAAPNFKAPLSCGQTWSYSTHSGHTSYERDFSRGGASTTAGQPVLASAAGTVVQRNVGYSGGMGNSIVIDHGDGWTTRYYHMQDGSLAVSQGAQVVQGQMLGRVGNTGYSFGDHLHFEQRQWNNLQAIKFNGGTLSSGGSVTSDNGCGGTTPPPATGKYWVDTHSDGNGRASPGGAITGTLYKGTSYVYCKVWGPNVQVGSNYNHWWLKTDLDVGPTNQWVSAWLLSRWGNDEAKDNNGTVIPNCP